MNQSRNQKFDVKYLSFNRTKLLLFSFHESLQLLIILFDLYLVTKFGDNENIDESCSKFYPSFKPFAVISFRNFIHLK